MSLDSTNQHFGSSAQSLIDRIPRITFLNPMVVEAPDNNGNPYDTLIEPQLDGKYAKFNNNMGMVKDQADSVAKEELEQLICSTMHGASAALRATEEGSEEEEEEESDDELYTPATDQTPDRGTYTNLRRDENVPQALSHFTFQRSWEAFLVVDPQGQFVEDSRSSKEHVLTDSVIHSLNPPRRQKGDKFDFGRTDRGKDGMKAFFLTRKCTDICRLLGLAPVSPETLKAKKA